jgi:hypothetical protein
LRRFTVTSSPLRPASRATTICPERASALRLHGKKVAVEDAGVLHALTAHPQQIIGARREQRGIDLHLRLDVLGSENRRARATRPTSGNPVRGNSGLSFKRRPRDAPGVIRSTPLRASARK